MAEGKSKVLQVSEAESQFRVMLSQSGVDSSDPDASKVWTVFQSFAQLTLPEPSILYFYCERDDRSLADGRRLCLECQMTVYNGADYDHIEYLTCMLCYPITPETRPLRCNAIEVEINCESALEDFVAEVEKTEPFKVLTSQFQPVKLSISQHEI